MRRFLALGVALATLSVAMPAVAQSDADAAAGATIGGATGGTIGFLLGGPIGAIFGGFTGAVIGADAAVSNEAVLYAGENPVDVVYLDSDLDVGFVLDADIEIHPIEGDDRYGYVYANNRVWIVDIETREIVQSPGFLVSEDAVAYVEANPVDDVEFSGSLEAGVTFDADVELAQIPDSDFYGYAYVDGRPVLVDLDSRTVIWVR